MITYLTKWLSSHIIICVDIHLVKLYMYLKLVVFMELYLCFRLSFKFKYNIQIRICKLKIMFIVDDKLPKINA